LEEKLQVLKINKILMEQHVFYLVIFINQMIKVGTMDI